MLQLTRLGTTYGSSGKAYVYRWGLSNLFAQSTPDQAWDIPITVTSSSPWQLVAGSAPFSQDRRNMRVQPTLIERVVSIAVNAFQILQLNHRSRYLGVFS